MSAHLLIVHPEPAVRNLLASMLQTTGHRLREADADRSALRIVESEPVDIVLVGNDATDPDALELLTYLRRKHPRIAVILIWAGSHPERTREALRHGAVTVLKYPTPANQLRAAVAQALGQPESNGHASGHRAPEPTPPADSPRPAADVVTRPIDPTPLPNGRTSADPNALIGDDPSVRQAVELATTIAPSRAPVLIVGEPGTGKTLLARMLHARSLRRDAPFVELSCGVLKEVVLESELFGRKGHYGEADRPGRLLQAHGGTLYLDDVAALSPALQFRLLRVLQDGTFEPNGSNQSARVDVRLIAATTEDLTPLVENGQFRQDLYYRLGVVTVNLPPLRHRGSDVERLAEHFRDRFAREVGRPVAGFSAEALDRLRVHDWPGNVLELESVVERAVLHCRGPRIESSHLALAPCATPAPSSRTLASPSGHPSVATGILPLKEALEGPERQLILQALEALNWNRQETARVLDINRTTLYKKMKKYGLLYDEPAWAN